MTIKATLAAIKALPHMTARRTYGEWRVTYQSPNRHYQECCAYYTYSEQDALDTARAMSANAEADNA